MTKKTICKHIGHTVKFFDSGYCVCDRCGSHEYYQPEQWRWTWHAPLYKLFVSLSTMRQRRYSQWRAEQERKRRVDNGDFPF